MNPKAFYLNNNQIKEVYGQHKLPLYVYSRQELENSAKKLLGLLPKEKYTLRFSMKANPHPEILKLFDDLGLHIDASSSYEADIALKTGVLPENIMLSSQQLPDNLKELISKGVIFDATSLHQLETFGKSSEGSEVSIRINPGFGSGHSQKVNTGGIASSFGIWHEYIPKIKEIAEKYSLKITRIHLHIGAGADLDIWLRAAKAGFKYLDVFSDTNILNLGGGIKVARMPDETETDLGKLKAFLKAELSSVELKLGRKLTIELEPGAYLTANAGVLLSTVIDIVDTGNEGYRFIKLNTGMNDFMRPLLYGAQHPIEIMNDSNSQSDYVVVGHNCESGDLLTPVPGQPEQIAPRKLKDPQIGDIVQIQGVGAYSASMRAKGYNSYPDAKEIFVD